MAKKPIANAADRPVMLSADSARRVGRMLQAYEGGDRAITPYVVPNGLVDDGGAGTAKFFTLNAELQDCHQAGGKEVTARMNLETNCIETTPVVPENVQNLYELSFLVTQHNIAKNKKLDTKLPVGALVQCIAIPKVGVPPSLVWIIVEILDCGCAAEIQDTSLPWCKIIGGVYLDDLPSGTPEFVVGITSDGCLCKVPVSPCIPTDPPYSPGGGG